MGERTSQALPGAPGTQEASHARIQARPISMKDGPGHMRIPCSPSRRAAPVAGVVKCGLGLGFPISDCWLHKV